MYSFPAQSKLQELLIPTILTPFSHEKKKDFYQLEGALSGTCYHRLKGPSICEYHIQTDVSSLVIHPLYHGSRELFLVFTAGEEQIALIERHTTVVNQKDTYTLYLTGRYEHTALLLSAWILLYDHQNYGDQREISAESAKHGVGPSQAQKGENFTTLIGDRTNFRNRRQSHCKNWEFPMNFYQIKRQPVFQKSDLQTFEILTVFSLFS